MISRKGAGDVLLYMVFVGIIALILIGLGIGIAALFGKGYDFRAAESEALMSRVQSCLLSKNMFASSFDFASCHLDSRVLEEDHLIYLTRSDGAVFSYGVSSYRETCFLKAAHTNLDYPQCKTFTLRVGDFIVEGIVGSAQRTRVVS